MVLNFILRTRTISNSSYSDKMISVLSIGLITILILWLLLYLKSRKLKAKIKRLENKKENL